MQRFLLTLVVVAAAFGAGLYMGWLNPDVGRGPSANAPLRPPEIERVVAQGRLVPYDGFVNVAGTPGARVDQLLVRENDSVAIGKTELATFVGQNLADLQVELAKSRTADVRTELEQKKLAAEINVRNARAVLESARLSLTQVSEQQDRTIDEQRIASAEQKLRRMQNLAEDIDTKNLVSVQAIESQRLDIASARNELNRALRTLEQTRDAAELAVGNATQNVASAEQSLVSASRLVDENRSSQLTESIAIEQARNSRLLAPIDGQVIKIFVKAGETIVNTPLLQLGNLQKMECVAEVNESLTRRVQPEQRVVIRSPAFARTIGGTVLTVGKVVGTPSLRDPNPLAMVDKRTVEVRIEIDSADVELARDFVNLQVAVEIETGDLSAAELTAQPEQKQPE